MLNGRWGVDDGDDDGDDGGDDDGDDDGGKYDVVLHTLPIHPDGEEAEIEERGV